MTCCIVTSYRTPHSGQVSVFACTGPSLDVSTICGCRLGLGQRTWTGDVPAGSFAERNVISSSSQKSYNVLARVVDAESLSPSHGRVFFIRPTLVIDSVCGGIMQSPEQKELAELRGRVSKLEKRVGDLESKGSGVSPATQVKPNPEMKRNETKV
jgi:hypothetical protein